MLGVSAGGGCLLPLSQRGILLGRPGPCWHAGLAACLCDGGGSGSGPTPCWRCRWPTSGPRLSHLPMPAAWAPAIPCSSQAPSPPAAPMCASATSICHPTAASAAAAPPPRPHAGAFTPGCTKVHLPGYVADYEKLKDAGAEVIVCVAVNDPFVMAAWGDAYGASGKVTMLADTRAALTKALDIVWDATAVLGNPRARRWAGGRVVGDGGGRGMPPAALPVWPRSLCSPSPPQVQRGGGGWEVQDLQPRVGGGDDLQPVQPDPGPAEAVSKWGPGQGWAGAVCMAACTGWAVQDAL